MYIHKNTTNDTQGFGIIGFLIIILGLSLLAGGSFFAYQQIATSGPEIEQSAYSDEKSRDKECRTQDEIQICAALTDESPPYADGYELEVEFYNTSNSTFEMPFSTGCNSPITRVNGSTPVKYLTRVCTQALTTVRIGPSSKENFTRKFTPDMLDDGQNSIQVIWGDLKSPEFIVDQLEITEQDKEKLREMCIRSQQPGPSCQTINVRFESRDDKAYFETYADIDEYLEERYGLGLYYSTNRPQDKLDSFFFISVPVPAFEKDYYEKLLEEDPLLPNVFTLPS